MPQVTQLCALERVAQMLGEDLEMLEAIVSNDDNLSYGNIVSVDTAVFVKVVVRRFHAASLISGALISVSGLSQTGPAGCQLRVLPDQRCGFCARAFA